MQPGSRGDFQMLAGAARAAGSMPDFEWKLLIERFGALRAPGFASGITGGALGGLALAGSTQSNVTLSNGTLSDARLGGELLGDSEPIWRGLRAALARVSRETSVPQAKAIRLALCLAARGAAVTVAGSQRARWGWLRWFDNPVTERPTSLIITDSKKQPVSSDITIICQPSISRRDKKMHFRAENMARELAKLNWNGRSLAWPAIVGGLANGENALPEVVPFSELLAVSPPGNADSGSDSWLVPIGVGSGGAVHFDLLHDGPHLLIAGTTGSGKSELLRALVFALAHLKSPTELNFVLIDFKGGASFGNCAQLPHVVGTVTDLDDNLATRAIAGLRAELRRRKTLLAQHQVSDIAGLPAGTIPRLVVVLDEFRALTEELPDAIEQLVRVAAQGRSLGVHLVLATQRIGGTISAEVRANVSARIALRVVDSADSLDLLDAPTAATLPRVAGRAVLKLGSAPPLPFQSAYADAAATAPQTVYRCHSFTGLATARRVFSPQTGPNGQQLMPSGLQPTPSGQQGPPSGLQLTPGELQQAPSGLQGPPSGHHPTDAPPSSSPEPPESAPDKMVRELRAKYAGTKAGKAPWQPALPKRISAAELARFQPSPSASAFEGGQQSGFEFAVADYPEQQAQARIAWQPTAGPLGIIGPARTGRSTALAALAALALAQGWQVHLLGELPPDYRALLRHPNFGTQVPISDLARAGRLLSRANSFGAQTLLLIDQVEQWRSRFQDLGADPLATLPLRVPLAVSAAQASCGGLAGRLTARLVLLSGDRNDDLLLGAPTCFAGSGRCPGRGVWLCAGDQALAQVALPETQGLTDGFPRVRLSEPTDQADLRGAVGSRTTQGHLTSQAYRSENVPTFDHSPLRLLELPEHLAGSYMPAEAVGLGGDQAQPLQLDLSGGALVVGPRGSGRTTALLTLLLAHLHSVNQAAEYADRRAAVGAEWETADGVLPLTPLGGGEHATALGVAHPIMSTEERRVTASRKDHPSIVVVGEKLANLAALVGARRLHPTAPTFASELANLHANPPEVLVIDDLDLLATLYGPQLDRLADLGQFGHTVIMGATTTFHATISQRGLIGHLRTKRNGVVLQPSDRNSGEVFAAELPPPHDPPIPGRGWLVSEGTVQPIQVALIE
jgi:S-DNA-T family DNA segregation ATPase FtsK/SpoIIIE